MADCPPLPEALNHDDLSHLSPTELEKHLQGELQRAMFGAALDARKAFYKRFPDATRLWSTVEVKVSRRKPSGYYDLWERLVNLWLRDRSTHGRTLGEDVDFLNRELGGPHFDRGNYLSKPMNGEERKRASKAFAATGRSLPVNLGSRADVKRAAVAAELVNQPDATPFAGGLVRTGDCIVGPAKSFTVSPHNGHDTLRVSVDGNRVRLRADAVRVFISEAGLSATASTAPLSYPLQGIGEVAPKPILPAETDPLETSGATSPQIAEEAAEPLSLSERIKRLRTASASPSQPTTPNYIDPLEL